MTTGKTKVYGLIGNPVAHSFSPMIHNTLAEKMGEDLTYVTFPVGEGKLEKAYNGLDGLGIGGANVTVPYKADIMKYIVDIDAEADNIGAVNTLVPCEGGFKGYNTDWLGLRQSLVNAGVTFEGKHVLMVGAGGSARATAVMCAKEGVASLVVVNRTKSKAIAIAELVSEKYNVKAIGCDYGDLPKTHWDLIFQTTSIGMHPKVEGCPVEGDWIFGGAEVAVDLIYNPVKTVFLQRAEAKGCKAINGMEMLFYQAVKAFELWVGREVSADIQKECLQIYKEALEKKMQGGS